MRTLYQQVETTTDRQPQQGTQTVIGTLPNPNSYYVIQRTSPLMVPSDSPVQVHITTSYADPRQRVDVRGQTDSDSADTLRDVQQSADAVQGDAGVHIHANDLGVRMPAADIQNETDMSAQGIYPGSVPEAQVCARVFMFVCVCVRII